MTTSYNTEHPNEAFEYYQCYIRVSIVVSDCIKLACRPYSLTVLHKEIRCANLSLHTIIGCHDVPVCEHRKGT